jgi:hypothetical protein
MYWFHQVIFLLFFLISSTVLAATQGTLGTTSTGTINISITLPALVEVTGFSDITLGSTSSFPATGNTTACIYSNVASPLGSYFVTATSQNTSGTDFRVKDSGTDFIAYSAFWNNASSASQTTSLTSGTKTAQQTGGSAVSLNCGGSPNANFNISFSAAQVQGAPAASYSDVVTLLISPT